jgi:acetylornithine deacetylase/succinyl-diaminopimelate desuccinylase-like protein
MSNNKDFEDAYFKHIEDNTELYIERLGEAVAMKSISSDLANHLQDIEDMMQWTKDHIERLNGTATLLSNPASTSDQKLPSILIGEFLVDPKKKTVCVYGHLDVQPAAKEDGWDTDPFVLTEKDGKLFGRGSTDDKGPALSWLWVVEAHQQLGIELPVNVKLIFEGMEVSIRHTMTCLKYHVEEHEIKRMMNACI